MEKFKAHYSLSLLKQAVAVKGVSSFTKTALAGGKALGLTTSEMLRVIGGLTNNLLYKSMTTYSDSSVWQDVYLAVLSNGRNAYIKITLVSETPVIQFKEK